MNTRKPLRAYRINGLAVRVFETTTDLGAAAAVQAVEIINDAVQTRGRARLVIGTGNSQDGVVAGLVASPEVDWSRVELFHMDEYVGMPESHPASFRRWLRTRMVETVHPWKAHYMQGDAPDLDAECRRYAELLNAAPIDIGFVGIGENGHIAFNDPHAADFEDAATVKRVTLDEMCRRQQVGEGHFAGIDAVPAEALTLTCPALMRAETLICCVPDRRKARAVARALHGSLSPECPASLVRLHARAFLYLDTESASMLGTRLESE